MPVVGFRGTVNDAIRLDPARVLAGAEKAALASVVVIGVRPDGDLYLAASEGTPQTVLLMEQAKAWLVAGCPD